MSDIIENFSEETNIFQQLRINKVAVMALAGYSQIEIAKELKLSDVTVRELMKNENFRRTLQLASARIFDSAIAKLCLNSVKAVDTVVNTLDSPYASDRLKLAAAKIILDVAGQAKTAQLEARLEQLESLVHNDHR